jgi:hypothetical protein
VSTIDAPTGATSREAPRAGLAGTTLRRWIGGVSLILFPALLLVQAVVVPEDGEGVAMYAAATEHRTSLLVSAALLIVSGILMVPAAVAISHRARGRGSALTNWAATLAVLGGIGHVGLGYFYVMSGALRGGERTEMVDYVDRLGSSPELMAFVFPFILCFALGVLLLPWAAYRAGLVERWAPVLATLAVLQHEVLPPEFPGQETINTIAIGALTVVFGHLGVRVLRLGDGAWTGQERH